MIRKVYSKMDKEKQKNFSVNVTEDQLLSMIEQSWKNIPHEKLLDMPERRSNQILDEIIAEPQKQNAIKRLWSPTKVIIGMAATILVVASINLYFFTRKTPIQKQEVQVRNDVPPGKNGGTLTLANGKKIAINDELAGNIATELGVNILKTKDGQLIYEVTDSHNASGYHTLSTARGEQTQIRLPDGSLVILNAESALTYPVNFSTRLKREVSLIGEGYFEVAKDKTHPFVVFSKQQEVEVLGTHFNINSYADEPVVATTLVEGSVKVRPFKGNETLLKPGYQSIYSDNTPITVYKVNTEAIVDWKNNDFHLNHLNFKTAMRKIARWYNVEIIYDSSVPDNMEAGGWISRDNKLSKVLEMIESSGLVRFRLEGRKLYVSK